MPSGHCGMEIQGDRGTQRTHAGSSSAPLEAELHEPGEYRYLSPATYIVECFDTMLADLRRVSPRLP